MAAHGKQARVPSSLAEGHSVTGPEPFPEAAPHASLGLANKGGLTVAEGDSTSGAGHKTRECRLGAQLPSAPPPVHQGRAYSAAGL